MGVAGYVIVYIGDLGFGFRTCPNGNGMRSYAAKAE